ncbi:MAG: ImmA/IrrE family metallo-endopeptidase [Victivallaceae bacterium]|nr:ImmA/IrrE family metallo-endopeptidase [Victivallaceae bacterium]
MSVKQRYKFKPDYAIPPGLTVKETIEALDMTQKEFAIRTGLTVQSLIRIFKGEQPISYETAERFEMVTGVAARFWNNLEMQYQEQMVKIAEKERFKNDLEWLKLIPVNELISRGVIPANKEPEEKLRNMLKFYGVNSVDAWNKIWEYPDVAARRSQCFETRPGPASAWIRLGELQVQKHDCASYDKNKFTEVLRQIRKLTTEPTGDFEEKLIKLCAEAGVALALVKEMKKVPWNGAAKWLSADKAMILLSLRGKSEDKFWFSFFHEAGHLLHDSKKDLFINDGTKGDLREQRADEFAAEILVPKHFNPLIEMAKSKTDIIQLAEKIGVSPGIIAGRYQHLTRKWRWFHDLIRKFEWA